ncbi:hypothetical protein ACWATR_37130 [Nostoc sp. UIC 10890]
MKEVRKHHRISEGVLEKHLKAFGQLDLIPEKKLTPTSQTNASKQFDFNSVNFEEYSFDENNPENVIEYFQKALLFMYGRQLQIVASIQERVYLGFDEDDYQSNSEWLKLEKIEGMLHRIYPIHIFANQRIALDVVSRMGYQITLPGDNINVIPIETDS